MGIAPYMGCIWVVYGLYMGYIWIINHLRSEMHIQVFMAHLNVNCHQNPRICGRMIPELDRCLLVQTSPFFVCW